MATNEANYQESIVELSPVKEIDEDRAALLASKAYAVVTRDDPYPLSEIEEDFI